MCMAVSPMYSFDWVLSTQFLGSTIVFNLYSFILVIFLPGYNSVTSFRLDFFFLFLFTAIFNVWSFQIHNRQLVFLCSSKCVLQNPKGRGGGGGAAGETLVEEKISSVSLIIFYFHLKKKSNCGIQRWHSTHCNQGLPLTPGLFSPPTKW